MLLRQKCSLTADLLGELKGQADGAQARVRELEAQLAAQQGLKAQASTAQARVRELEAQLAAQQASAHASDAQHARATPPVEPPVKATGRHAACSCMQATGRH